jgi:hypothetical protein
MRRARTAGGGRAIIAGWSTQRGLDMVSELDLVALMLERTELAFLRGGSCWVTGCHRGFRCR